MTGLRQVGGLSLDGIPEIPARISERTRQYRSTRYATLYGWIGAGEELLIGTRFGQTNQLHRVSQPGGARQQLTFCDEPVWLGRANPDPGRRELLFIKDEGGNEAYQIHHVDLTTGHQALLTDGASRNSNIVWANGGERLAHYSTRRNGRDLDIWVTDPSGADPPRCVLETQGYWYPVAWSPDDRRLLVTEYVSAGESNYHILDLETGALTPVNTSGEPAYLVAGHWSGDGEGLYVASDQGTEFRTLRYLDLGTGEQRQLTGDIAWDVEDIEVSPGGDRIAAVVNEGGGSRLYLMDGDGGGRCPVEGLPLGVMGRVVFDRSGDHLAFDIETPQSPRDVYVIHLGTGRVVRWTYSEVGGLSREGMVAPELVHYPTFDQAAEPNLAGPNLAGGRRGPDGTRQIACYCYRPAAHDGPVPVVVDIHGGPESQYKPVFSWFYQFLVRELKVAVLAPNVRGSTGYGKSFTALDDGYRREDAVGDIGALLDWVEAQPWADQGRVAVMGGSYGGYMVLASMIHYNERLRCGLCSVGISNFVTFLENTKGYRQDLRRVEYGDERDPEMRAFLERISPTTGAAAITRPMLMSQGLEDPRVPAREAEQMVTTMRGNGCEVWNMVAADEGHGFLKKANVDCLTDVQVLFLEEHLTGDGARAAPQEGDPRRGKKSCRAEWS